MQFRSAGPRGLGIAVLTVVAVGLLAGCGQSPPPAAPPAPAVTVANPVRKVVSETDEFVGRFIAVDAVEVRARVSGYLDAVHFTDGQLVKQGDLLFTIDRRPFETTLAQAKANLAQAKANLAFTETDLNRAQQLVRDKTITEQTFDQRIQAKRVAEANVAAQEAAVQQAELDLTFTELRAPVSGRIGDRRVSPGNLVTGGVTGNTTLLATIVSTDPIRFEFTIDEASFIRYQRLAKEGVDSISSRDHQAPVLLRLIDEKAFSHKGRMDFIDNVVDKSSGTIRGRAEFDNAGGLFTPGVFARIQVPAAKPGEALLVPDVAIGSEQVRKFVYVVGDDNVAKPKYVVLGQLVDGLRVIREGLSPDDRVVVNGVARIRPMMKVTPQPQGAPAPGPSAAAPAK
ncbi:efflux RND transporter periplasmic adaptor subunit [Blastochloris tepida]|uniref:MexE family multidrug efflux RND transporter periplasmic adaptor subunit n=1 Tax=Blastochloris tepida TaxID=2233851 RepID=A0A348G3R0_9HYPH|nr:efflux RND transporter periplasmic adaptor subunit [Blastochloris tepida]BBF94193.1 MexE family multidrug efflux RND transporter periplasmic adaptor subunit [Blastochloris tepida]